MLPRYACAFLTVFALISPSAIGSPKSSPAHKPAIAAPTPVPASALTSLLPNSREPPFRTEIRGENLGAGHVGWGYEHSPGEAIAHREWKYGTERGYGSLQVTIIVTANPDEAVALARRRVTECQDVHAEVTGRSPLVRFADRIWYDVNDGANSVPFRPAPIGQNIAPSFRTDTTIHYGSVTFCRSNVVVSVSIFGRKRYHPSDLLALGARVARRIDAAAKAAKPAPPPRRPLARTPSQSSANLCAPPRPPR